MRSIIATGLLIASTAFAQSPLPANAIPFQVVQGRGVQIYTCTTGEWKFTAPEADLFDGETKIGTHGAGPTWIWNDGSSITGKLLESKPAPDFDANIPWLTLSATPREGTAGVLSSTKFVRRTDTVGGIAPSTGCDTTNAGEKTRIPYTAKYSFYR